MLNCLLIPALGLVLIGYLLACAQVTYAYGIRRWYLWYYTEVLCADS